MLAQLHNLLVCTVSARRFSREPHIFGQLDYLCVYWQIQDHLPLPAATQLKQQLNATGATFPNDGVIHLCRFFSLFSSILLFPIRQ